MALTQDGQGGVAAEFTLEEGKSQVFILRGTGHRKQRSLPASRKGSRRAVSEHSEILAQLALWLHVPRTLARAGAEIGIGP